jgi:hypothetical protein
MKSPQWHDALEPRIAVVAGVVGLAVVWPIGRYAFNAGYLSLRYKDLVTAVDLLAFVIPYLAVKWVLKRRRTLNQRSLEFLLPHHLFHHRHDLAAVELDAAHDPVV